MAVLGKHALDQGIQGRGDLGQLDDGGGFLKADLVTECLIGLVLLAKGGGR